MSICNERFPGGPVQVRRTAGFAGQPNTETVLPPDFAPQQTGWFEMLRGAAKAGTP